MVSLVLTSGVWLHEEVRLGMDMVVERHDRGNEMSSLVNRLEVGEEEKSATYNNKVHYVVVDLQFFERAQQYPSREAGDMSVHSLVRQRTVLIMPWVLHTSCK